MAEQRKRSPVADAQVVEDSNGSGEQVATSSSQPAKPRKAGSGKGAFSTVKWMRRVDNGEQLSSSTASSPRSVPASELAKHTEPGDVWLAVEGEVYDVSEYAPYHPGGESQISRGAGSDATSLFKKYHSWVNFREMLQPCYIGALDTSR